MYEKYPNLVKATVALLFTVLLVYSVEAASEILVPILLAVLFAYLLYPLARQLEAWKVPRAIADFATVLLTFTFLLFVMFLFYKQMGGFVKDLPNIRQQAIANFVLLEGYISQHVSFAPQNQNNWLQEKAVQLINTSSGPIATALTATTTSIAKLFILPFIIFFFLYYRERFKDFVLSIVPTHKHEATGLIIEEVSQVTKRYMSGLFLVVAIIALLNCVSLKLIGIKYPIFLGLLAAMFNFIPYFGTLFGAVIPVSVTFLTSDSPKQAIFVIIYFAVIQMLEHNIFTPKITGSQVKINPLFTLFSLLVGATMFGVAGMFIAIPFTGMFKIFCEHVESLKPLARLIGEPE